MTVEKLMATNLLDRINGSISITTEDGKAILFSLEELSDYCVICIDFDVDNGDAIITVRKVK